MDDCRVDWLGWSEDGQTLRWVLEPDGDEHTATDAGRTHAGNYITRWDGTAPVRRRAGFDPDIGAPIVGYPPDSKEHDWVSWSPSRNWLAWRSEVHLQPWTTDTVGVWASDSAAHVARRIASASSREGWVSLLGWLKQ